MRALILVDIQNDFLPGGALAVQRGNEVVAPANRIQRDFELVVATQDWHPKDHASFAANHPGKKPGEVIELGGLSQVLWPVHCVQESSGAELAPELEAGAITRIFQKGTDRSIDSYSGFFDNGHQRATGLADWLKAREVDEIYVLGLATDYCVKFTALDALSLGFRTHVYAGACRAVDLRPGDGERALDELRRAGVDVIGGSGTGR